MDQICKFTIQTPSYTQCWRKCFTLADDSEFSTNSCYISNIMLYLLKSKVDVAKSKNHAGEAMDTHRYTHLQKVVRGMESEYVRLTHNFFC